MKRANPPDQSGAPLVRVLLVDDHEMVARSLAAVLGDAPDIEVVGIAATEDEAVEQSVTLTPDVVVMDYRLADGDGIAAARQIGLRAPDANVVMLTSSPERSVLMAALEAGCSGFVPKASGIEELLTAVRAAAGGAAVFGPEVMSRLLAHSERDQAAPGSLSPREQEVLQLVAAGVGTGAIAKTLGLSQHTVRNHMRNLMAKLDAHSKLEAVVNAARHGLVTLPADD